MYRLIASNSDETLIGMITENKTNKVLYYAGLDFDIANALYKKD